MQSSDIKEIAPSADMSFLLLIPIISLFSKDPILISFLSQIGNEIIKI